MTTTVARIDNERFNTDALAIAALTGKVGSRVFSKESLSWFFNDDGAIRQEKEYQTQINSLSSTVSSQGTSIANLVNADSALQAELDALEATVSGIPAGPQGPQGLQGTPGASYGLGQVVPPYGAYFRPDTIDAVDNEQLFVEFDALPDYGVAQLWLSTKYLWSVLGLSGGTRVTFTNASPNVQVDIEFGDEGGYSTYSITAIPDATPGTYALVAYPSNGAFGYLVTTDDGLSIGTTGSTFSYPKNENFSIARSELETYVDAYTTQAGRGKAWEFSFRYIVNCPTSTVLTCYPTLDGAEFTSAPIELDLYSMSGEQYLGFKFLVEYLGVRDAGGGYLYHGFRTTISSVEGPAGVISPTCIDGEIQDTALLPNPTDRLWFSMPFNLSVDSSATVRFDNLTARAHALPVFSN